MVGVIAIALATEVFGVHGADGSEELRNRWCHPHKGGSIGPYSISIWYIYDHDGQRDHCPSSRDRSILPSSAFRTLPVRRGPFGNQDGGAPWPRLPSRR